MLIIFRGLFRFIGRLDADAPPRLPSSFDVSVVIVGGIVDETMTDVIRLARLRRRRRLRGRRKTPTARPDLMDSLGRVNPQKVSNWVLLSDRPVRSSHASTYYHFKLTAGSRSRKSYANVSMVGAKLVEIHANAVRSARHSIEGKKRPQVRNS